MLITTEEAHRIIRHSIVPFAGESSPLDKLQCCVLAGDIAAPFALPRFTNAAMDGFALKGEAIRHASRETPVRLQVTEAIPAGSLSRSPVVAGCCAQIMTGAPLPEGTDTVVAFEDTSGFGSSYVDIYKAPNNGANVRHRAEEVREGDKLLKAGLSVTPAEIAVLSSFGCSVAEVKRKPAVAIVTVGDELRLPGEEVAGAAIFNCNRFMLQASCRAIGIEPVCILHAPDDRTQIRETLAHALAAGDILITAGGISTGVYDFVARELSQLGVIQKFWSVSQKPGKPLYFGSSNSGKPVFSLPGNPVSALVCFVEYCVPAFCLLQGKPVPDKLQAILAEPFPADKKRHRFLLGKAWVEEGKLLCTLAQKVESHMITSLVGANCLLESGPAPEPIPAWSLVTCAMLPWATL